MFSRELSAASAKPMVLAILNQGESYGYKIIQQVKKASGDKVEWAEGALYPVLHRLEKQGLVSSFWQKSEQGRKRKYYRITKEGRRVLIAERQQWELATSMLDKLWGGLSYV